MFSCFAEFLQKILAFSLIWHLVYSHQSLIEEQLLLFVFKKESSFLVVEQKLYFLK